MLDIIIPSMLCRSKVFSNVNTKNSIAIIEFDFILVYALVKCVDLLVESTDRVVGSSHPIKHVSQCFDLQSQLMSLIGNTHTLTIQLLEIIRIVPVSADVITNFLGMSTDTHNLILGGVECADVNIDVLLIDDLSDLNGLAAPVVHPMFAHLCGGFARRSSSLFCLSPFGDCSCGRRFRLGYRSLFVSSNLDNRLFANCMPEKKNPESEDNYKQNNLSNSHNDNLPFWDAYTLHTPHKFYDSIKCVTTQSLIV